MKTSFNLDDYKGNYAMHCKTEDEANSFLEILHSAGRKWCSGESYVMRNAYNAYKHLTVYLFNKGTYSYVGSDFLDDCTILEWSDFIENEDEDEVSDEEFQEMLNKLFYT